MLNGRRSTVWRVTRSARPAAASEEPESAALLGDNRFTVMGLFFEAQSALERRLDHHLRAGTGMPLASFEVLIRLGRSPGGRMRQTEVVRQLSITTGGVTRLVDRIEGAGLLRRVPDPADRRATFVEITEAGRTALREALAVHIEALQADFVDPLSPEDYAALAQSLRVLRDHLVGDPADRIPADG